VSGTKTIPIYPDFDAAISAWIVDCDGNLVVPAEQVRPRLQIQFQHFGTPGPIAAPPMALSRVEKSVEMESTNFRQITRRYDPFGGLDRQSVASSGLASMQSISSFHGNAGQSSRGVARHHVPVRIVHLSTMKGVSGRDGSKRV
jgi:hypothetical protein